MTVVSLKIKTIIFNDEVDDSEKILNYTFVFENDILLFVYT